MNLKNSLLACLWMASLSSFRTNEPPADQNLPTSIDHVVVYQQGAQIERVAPVTIPVGTSTLVFSALHTGIDPSQLRVTGNGDFKVLSITHRYQTDTLGGGGSAEGRRQLQLLRNDLQDNIAAIQTRKIIFDREEQLLLNNQGFSVKDSGVDLDRLMRASVFYRERFAAIHQGRQDLNQEIMGVQSEMSALDLKIAALPILRTETFLELVIRVEAEIATKGELLLSYWMQNAGWNPSYNARVEAITDPLRLEYQAMVFQNTGEDWGNVGLSIATGTPSKNRSKPQLQPWMLDGTHPGNFRGQSTANSWLKAQPYNPNVRQIRGQLNDANGFPLVGAQVIAGGAQVTTDINGFYSMNVPVGVSQVQYRSVGHNREALAISDPVMNVSLAPNMEILEAVVVSEDAAKREALFSPRTRRREAFDQNSQDAMQFAAVSIEHNPTQTRFDIDAEYDIPSDGKRHAVRVLEHHIPVDYLYQSTPKLDPKVYLTALFTDWEELDLLNGRMHIYFEDDYVGESQLRLDFTLDTLAISLGPDPSIQVRRKRTMREDRSSLISGKREFLREYVFTITNRKQSDIHIQIDDQLPLAQNEDIEINRLKLDGAEVNNDTGQVIWDLHIKAGEEEEKLFRYEVKSPKDAYVQVL